MTSFDTPDLITERLVLRRPDPADAAAVLTFRGDPEVQRFDEAPLRSHDEALDFVGRLRREAESGEARYWLTIPKDGGAAIGLCSLWHWDAYHHRAELGFTLRRDLWGRGLAFEAAVRVLEYGFRTAGLHRIEAVTVVDNHRSARLLERLGFKREGVRRERSLEDDGLFHDSAQYGMLDREFGGPQ